MHYWAFDAIMETVVTIESQFLVAHCNNVQRFQTAKTETAVGGFSHNQTIAGKMHVEPLFFWQS